MSKLDEFFKYKIGDTLKVKSYPKIGLFLIHIVERSTQECPGGIQFHYTGRVISTGSIQNDWVRFNEIELEEYDAKKYAQEEFEREHVEYKKSQEMRKEIRAEMKKREQEEDDEKE